MRFTFRVLALAITLTFVSLAGLPSSGLELPKLAPSASAGPPPSTTTTTGAPLETWAEEKARVAAEEAARDAAAQLAATEAAEQAAQALREAVQRSLQAVPPPLSASGDFAAFRACTIEIESHGNYQDVDSTQTYWGAWQFLQSTWDSNAAAMGRPDLVGQVPNGVSPADQDAVAAFLYSQRGNAPWGGRC